ncbi:LAQU0S06e05622g1_1 [Lachancea quebecensis]|uniref:LAQU0S06e05622g1_1 n=1 Tax=Lachancea quebecensis TaxID=1654605 RepID=A0A0P1KSP1_9SACH|nr:LAQU0S06e05622g1_1 [Lachancea quebecensis]
MAPATPPRSRNRRGKAVCPSSPQLLTRPVAPVTPGSVSGKRHAGQLQKLRSPLNRSPARGLRTPEYTPAKPTSVGASAQARRKLEFPDDQQELAGVGRVLFPGPSFDTSTLGSRLLSPQAPGRLLRDAPALLPPAPASKAFAAILDEQFFEDDALQERECSPTPRGWETPSRPTADPLEQAPSTPSDKIVTFDLARDWNNNSSRCFSSDEEPDETSIQGKILENPFDDHIFVDEETRRRRQELLLAEDPTLQDTVTYVDKKGEASRKRHLSSEEQERFRPRMLFEQHLRKKDSRE